jgi:hypothetical protein
MKRKEGKGKANSISGIPLENSMAQVEGQSAEPNRDEPPGAFKVEDSGENYPHDYFDDEIERLGDLLEPTVANKSDREWSDGLKDEENDEDLADGEGVLPEIQPLHLDRQSPGEDEGLDTVLRPDNVGDDAAA